MDQNNILSKYSRTPKIYLTLPSGGKFYKNNPCERSGTGEIPILSMTAKDELIFRTPDALMNGDAVATVIKSCVPLIDDPWDIPSIDMDAILIAIRIATTGEKLEMDVKVPKVEDEELKVEIGLPEVLDGIKSQVWQDTFTYNDLTFHLIPLKLKHQNFFDIETFETQRFINILNDKTLSQDKRKQVMQEILDKASMNNIDVVAKQIVKITTPEGEEINPTNIAQFLAESDRELFNAVRDFLINTRSKFDIPVQKVTVPQPLVDQGAPTTISVPVFLNNVNFFV